MHPCFQLWGATGLRTFCVIALVSSLLLFGCSSEEPQEVTEADSAGQAGQADGTESLAYGFNSLLPAEVEPLLARGADLTIVDVRTVREREQMRIPGSVEVGFEEALSGRLPLPKDKPILLVCAVGGRSYAAGLALNRSGYSRLFNLRGGIAAWQRAGMPLEYGPVDSGDAGAKN